MSNRGRLSAPGDLGKPGSLSGPGSLPADGGPGSPATTAAPSQGTEPTASDLAGAGIPSGESLAAFATRYDLEPASARPPILKYLRLLWQRRQFITGFATASNVAMYSEARLGQLWQVLTPLLNAAVYFFIFGVLLHVNRGVPGYIPFLVTGIFVFNFTQRSCITSSTVMRDNLPLIRALPFPRGCLPLGYVIIELQQLLLSFTVLFVIILASGERLTWYWLLTPLVLVFQTLFNVGCAFILARWGSSFDDVSQLLPFIIRTWMYASGVIFSISTSLALVPGQSLYNHKHLAYLLQINPAAVYITLIRNSLLDGAAHQHAGLSPLQRAEVCDVRQPSEIPCLRGAVQERGHLLQLLLPSDSQPCPPCGCTRWAGRCWLSVAGFVYFWRAETRYGRG